MRTFFLIKEVTLYVFTQLHHYRETPYSNAPLGYHNDGSSYEEASYPKSYDVGNCNVCHGYISIYRKCTKGMEFDTEPGNSFSFAEVKSAKLSSTHCIVLKIALMLNDTELRSRCLF